MAYFIRVVRARRIKSKWRHYVQEKEIGLNAEEDESESGSSKYYSLSKRSKFRRKLRELWSAKLVKIKIPSTVRSIVWKSFLGFIGGILLTCIFFFFFHVGVNFSIRTSTCVCALLGTVLSIGLAFSSEFRCFVLLLLPVFFSKQGRQALLTYALFLAFTGPGRNIMHNMEVLSESLTCGQEMVRKTLRQINDMVKAPVRAVRETMQKVVKSVEEVVGVVKKFTTKMKRVIISILKVIKMATTWLGSVVNFCNKKIGTPFQRCMKAFDESIADCKAKLGALDFLCHVVHVVKGLCYTVKCLDFVCLFTGFVSNEIVGTVRKNLRKFHRQMEDLFYVTIEFNHSCKFETNAANATKEVSKTILQKLSKKVEKLQTIFSFFGFVFSLFFLFLFAKVYYYKHKYLSSDRYDNVYISNYIVDLDMRRAQMDRETVLPLEPREKKLYAKPTSMGLLKAEKSRIAESIFLLILTSFKIVTFLLIDYSLFWILITIYEAGRDGLDKVEESKAGIQVQGKGILADFYRKLGQTLEVPENPNTYLNPLACLPDPVHPDTGRYLQIGFLVALSWILTATEAYGLRLRNVVMSHYYPHRARQRAVWLYNHIIQSRSSFIRYARRQLRRKFGAGTAEEVPPNRRLFARFPLVGAVLGRSRENDCLICGGPESKSQPLKRCRMPDCRGRYCLDCFASVENACTICRHPMDYGDISDMSEEIDSSEEESCGRAGKNFGREFGGDDGEEIGKFLTFKEMEERDRFRDVEANKWPDYAKLGDLYSDKGEVQRRLKAVIQKRLRNIQRKKRKASQTKESEYQKVRTRRRLKDIIRKLKNNYLQRIRKKKLELKEKFVEKVDNLRKLKERKTQLKEQDEVPLDEGSKPEKPRSRVSFKLEADDEEEPTRRHQHDYGRLKVELKAKIESLKRRKLLRLTEDFADGGSLA